jgi:dihydropteroate synthase
MGVLNVTPDSFSDGGGLFLRDAPDLSLIKDTAQHMVAVGAAIIDVGGESTRPGATAVSSDEELRRIMPVVELLLGLDTIVSVDTCKASVAREALAAGCHLINDVTGFADRAMLDVVADSSAAVCIMHMQGEPRTMQSDPSYENVVSEVAAILAERVMACRNAGIDAARICIDPGFGFGKTMAHNLELLRNLESVRTAQLPLVVGLSRKSMLGAITGRETHERTAASVAAALLAVQNGANIVRAHDVAPTVDALKVLQALDLAGCTESWSTAGVSGS